MTAGELLHGRDAVAVWIRLALLTRRVVGLRMELGPTPERDEALDKLMVLRARTAQRLVN